MLGQFLLDAAEDDPVELLEGVVLVEPVELLEPVADVPLVLVEPVLVLDVVVAALATSAPPVMRPLVSAPTAMTLRRRRIFMVIAPSCWSVPPRLEEHHHPALRICGWVLTHIKPR
jgi:hypothetical protein